MRFITFVMSAVIALSALAHAMEGSAILPYDGAETPIEKRVQDVCDGIDEKFIGKHINILSFEIMGKRNAYSLCEVVIKAEGDYLPLYASKEGDFLILGEMFSSKVHISGESVLKYERRDFDSNREALDKAVAFTYKPDKDVREVLYFITDPQCPHCENAKEKVKEIADSKGLELRVLFFPISSLSKDKAIKGICSKMSYDDYLKGKYAGASCPEGQEKIENSMKVGRKLKIRGVPTFITGKGLILEGFNAEGIGSL